VTDLVVEKISESLGDNLATSTKTSLDTTTDTSNFVSPISPDDDMWLTIAQNSMLYWDTVAREATLHLKGGNGLLKKDEIVSDYITDLPPHVMLPNAVDFIDEELQIFKVPLPSSNTAISSSDRLVIPLSTKLPSDLDSSDIIDDVTCDVIGLKKLSRSLYKVSGHKKTSPCANDVARILDGSFNPID
jgi:hypothetical protein